MDEILVLNPIVCTFIAKNIVLRLCSCLTNSSIVKGGKYCQTLVEKKSWSIIHCEKENLYQTFLQNIIVSILSDL